MAAPGAFKRAMLEAFRPLFHRSGYHPRLTLGAARTTDRQKLWTRCFPHGAFLANFSSLFMRTWTRMRAKFCRESKISFTCRSGNGSSFSFNQIERRGPGARCNDRCGSFRFVPASEVGWKYHEARARSFALHASRSSNIIVILAFPPRLRRRRLFMQ